MFSGNPPLGLYVHLPWCVQKCPYCDFNSHAAESIPEQEYVDALLDDLAQDLPLVWGRSIDTMFIGGGTPSLFSGEAIDRLLSGLRALLNFAPAIEITLESNPGSAEALRYRDYRQAGINRLSIGVQSFNDGRLGVLGRIHNSDEARQAFAMARDAGFDNINLDLMYGLPDQDAAAAVADLEEAIKLEPEHISHYQLTLEPNTLFHHAPPANLPDDDLAWEQQIACQNLLVDRGYQHYEVSAWSRPNQASEHNLNYWQFGDYLGIGAGAHGKITLPGENRVIRRTRVRQPRAYLQRQGPERISGETELTPRDLVFEFMLNVTRLRQGFAESLFPANTGLPVDILRQQLKPALERGFIEYNEQKIVPTELGFRFLNDLQGLFLDLEIEKNRPFFHSQEGIIHN